MNHEDWGEGPWDNEEDHYVWVDEATNLDCMINRGPSGALCGYVGVGPDHPLHGVEYDDIDVEVEVHGGLTYSDSCQEDGEICHVPAEGRSHDIWWLGFDCGHHMDLAPAMEATMRRLRTEHNEPHWVIPPSKYRDVEYVRGEIRDLALQLEAMTYG